MSNFKKYTPSGFLEYWVVYCLSGWLHEHACFFGESLSYSLMVCVYLPLLNALFKYFQAQLKLKQEEYKLESN